MPQHHVQPAAVGVNERLERAFATDIEGVVRSGSWPQETRAQHRRQRETDRHRYQDSRRDRDRKFAKQAADDATHQKQRDEDCHQRQTDGDDGEAYFARTFQRRLHQRRALLEMPVNILDHHDRIVHDEADRNRQPHQREIVEAVTHQIHPRKGAQHGQRHRCGGNDRGANLAKEQEHHQHDECNGEQQREFDIAHRSANRLGAIEDGFEPYSMRKH